MAYSDILALELKRPLPDTCLRWWGYMDRDSYGTVRYQGKMRKVARVAYALYYQKGFLPPDNLEIRHTCDNPRCYNPKHLLLGTKDENLEDQRQRYARLHPQPPKRPAHHFDLRFHA